MRRLFRAIAKATPGLSRPISVRTAYGAAPISGSSRLNQRKASRELPKATRRHEAARTPRAPHSA